MKHYGRIQGLVLALGLPAFYRDVARSWGGIGFLYLLLLFALTWVPVLVRMQINFGRAVREEFPKVVKDFPTIILQAGKVSSPVQQPFIIDDPKTGNQVFILDTTGKITSLEKNPSPAAMLVTESKMHLKNQGKLEIHDLSQFPDFTISKDVMEHWLGIAANYLAVGLFPIVMIGSLIRALVVMLLAALLGLIFNSSSHAGLGFGGLLRLAAVGMTLPVYVDMGLGLAGIAVPFWFLITVAITTAYVAFGTYAAGPPPLPEDTDEGLYRTSDPSRASDQGHYRSSEDSPKGWYPED